MGKIKPFAIGVGIGFVVSEALAYLVDKQYAKKTKDQKPQKSSDHSEPSKKAVRNARNQEDVMYYWRVQDRYNEFVSEIVKEAEQIMRGGK